MFVIFGWEKHGERVKPLIDTHCYHCNNAVTWDWVKVTEWVSFFFVRVVPFKSEHFLGCGICGDAIALDNSEVRRLKKLHRLSRRKSSHLHGALVARLEQHQFEGMTENQIRWHKARMVNGS